jgi:uncharacterized protein YeaO (DUF488 family)
VARAAAPEIGAVDTGIFRRRYFGELDARPEAVKALGKALGTGTVTLLFGSREMEWNNAVALREYLQKGSRPRSG